MTRGPAYIDRENDDASTFVRASRFLTGQGRRPENDRTPEFNFQIVGDINEDPRWEGGPLSGALNALPRPIRAWLDTEGRLARIGVGQFLNADPEDRAQIILNNVPSAEVRRDEYGNLQVRLRPDHEWAYLNSPGLSSEDALTTGEVIARYSPAARVSALPRTFAGRGATAFATGAATEEASQQADDLVGGPEGADHGRSLEAGAWNMGGQVVFDTAAAAYQAGRQVMRGSGGGGRTDPLPPPQGAAPRTAREAFEGPNAPPRDFARERQNIETRARSDRQALEEDTFNRRAPTAGRTPNELAENPESAATLTPGQERVIEDHIRRTRQVEQERRAAHARLDNEELGMDLSPPQVLHDEARRAMAAGTPVHVTTPQGVRRVQYVRDEGFIDEAGDWTPSAGMIAEMTDDGLLFSRPPRPQRTRTEPPSGPAEPPTVATAQGARASDIYAASDEFGIPVSRGEATRDVAQRTREFDMLHGTQGPAAQRRAAQFQDQRANAIEEAGRRIATRNQDPLASNVDDAGQIVQNQVRDTYNSLTQQINQSYHEAMTRLAGVEVGKSAQGMMDSVGRRLMYGRGNIDDVEELLIPVTGYDVESVLGVTKSRAGTALRMVRDLEGEIASRAAYPSQGRVRFSHVERVRQRLLEIQEEARAANDADAYAVDLILQGFDDWLGPALQRPPQIRIRSPGAALEYSEQQALRQQAEQAITRARSLYREREELFTRQGAGDLAGRTMQTVRDLDTTGTQIINQILGSNRIPPSQARASVERIVTLATRRRPDGSMAPRAEETSAYRRFIGGDAQPPPEVQALREALFIRILEPLRTRGAGNQVPVQTVVTNLDTALNGPGRAVTRAMFTEAEVKKMERLLSVLRYYIPTSASRPTGVTAARMLGGAVDGVTRFISGAPGMLLRSVVGIISPGVKETGGEIAAAQAFRRPLLEDGFPSTTSGGPYAQLLNEPETGDGVDVPLEPPPPSTAQQAYEAAIDTNRPILSSDNGEFSTERTITVEVDGQFLNIPTIVNGRQLSVSAALREWEEGRNAEVGRFNTEAEAVTAARRPSDEIGRRRRGEVQ